MKPLLIGLLLLGCKRAPPEAPKDLQELSQYLYRNWENDDPEVMAAGMDNLLAFLDKTDLQGNIQDRSFLFEPPTEEDLLDVRRPEGTSLGRVIGVGVGGLSQWPVNDHARLQTERNQLPTEPTAKVYVRTFPEGEPSCFADQSCDLMVTENDVRRANLFINVDFILYKDFRWVEFGEDGDKRGFISRSFTDKVWKGDGGNTAIVQSYSLDAWLGRGSNTKRFQVVWSQSKVAVKDENLIAGTLKSATDNIFKEGDKAIEDLYR